MLSKQKITRFAIVGLIVTIISCEEKVEEPYVAKVGDNYLTEISLNEVIPNKKGNEEFRESYIRQWIEEQLLFLAASDRGILNQEEYENIIIGTRIKTANSMLMRELMEETVIKIDSNSVENYFKRHPSEFKTTSPAILFNYASFVEYDHAENFRKSLFNYSWRDAVLMADEHKELYVSGQEIFSYLVTESPDIYKKVHKTLYPNEISNVMITMNGLFLVFQLLEKHEINEIPEIESIYDHVKERYAATQRELAYKNYIKELYSTYSTRIER